MEKLTFVLDCQLNDQEDWIKEGTQVKIYPHWKNNSESTMVIIENAFTRDNKPLKLNQIEYFMNISFKELRELRQ